jgi:hypothetical protein
MGLLNPCFLYCQVLSSLLKIAECFSFRYLILDSAPAAEATILSDLLSRLRIAFARALRTDNEVVFLMNNFLD